MDENRFLSTGFEWIREKSLLYITRHTNRRTIKPSKFYLLWFKYYTLLIDENPYRLFYLWMQYYLKWNKTYFRLDFCLGWVCFHLVKLFFLSAGKVESHILVVSLKVPSWADKLISLIFKLIENKGCCWELFFLG